MVIGGCVALTLVGNAAVRKGGALDSPPLWGHLSVHDPGCGREPPFPRMRSLWNSAEAAGFPGDLGQRVYSSRLLGRDPSLVLHGGGNTSVKVVETNLFGEEEPVL